MSDNDNGKANSEDQVLKITRQDDTWFYANWRPFMAWQYAVVCIFDFLLAPIVMAIIQTIGKLPITQWHPITLEGAGLYHMAMMAIVGITSWTRGQERIAQINSYDRITGMVQGPNRISRYEAPGMVIEKRNIRPSGTDLLDADQAPPKVDPSARFE